ncbi:glycosyltransferase [Zavarzinia compransoris]|uniref:glycosyltransferase n=1 Tax=Zavarzinia marina TaxID=2911065 RepID=UPI001F19C2D0|nr:glycosyltransferase [Zavarzinia marina]MCF4166146.1 glycosyltransferase [Zavarzinia marina]
MRITILAVGTQGDVRPFIALSRELQARGHEITITTGRNFEDLIRGHGIGFSPMTADYEKLMRNSPELVERGMNLVQGTRIMRGLLHDMAQHWAEEGRAACEGAELIVGQGSGTVLAMSLAEAFGVPSVQVQFQPVTPCSDIPPVMLPQSPFRLPGFINRGLYHGLRITIWQLFKEAINDVVRKDLGLPPVTYSDVYRNLSPERRRVLYAYSEAVLPRSRDWTELAQVTGYWFLDEGADWTPPDDLARFLEAGEKPVYIGFGSMLTQKAEAVTRMVLGAVKEIGCRAVLATGWGGLSADPSLADANVFVLKQAPHDWLFPRMAGAVHHGGAGTTAAACRAGIPSLIMPFITEQAFWSGRLEEKGIAPPRLNRKTVTQGAFKRGITRLLDPAMKTRAEAVGAKIRAEDGIGRAIDQLTEWGLLTQGEPQPTESATRANAV